MGKIKPVGMDLSYRPFHQDTVRHRWAVETEGWEQVKKRLSKDRVFRSLAISRLHVYIADGAAVGVSVFVANLLPRLNIEIIFPAASHAVELREGIPASVYHAVRRHEWREVRDETRPILTSSLLNINPMAFLEAKVLYAYAQNQLDDCQGAMKTFQEVGAEMNEHQPGFKGSCASVALELLLTQAECKATLHQLPEPQEERAYRCSDVGDDEEPCAVCFEHIPDVQTPCHHRFCVHCCDRWFHQRRARTCPLCCEEVGQLDYGNGEVVGLA